MAPKCTEHLSPKNTYFGVACGLAPKEVFTEQRAPHTYIAPQGAPGNRRGSGTPRSEGAFLGAFGSYFHATQKRWRKAHPAGGGRRTLRFWTYYFDGGSEM